MQRSWVAALPEDATNKKKKKKRGGGVDMGSGLWNIFHSMLNGLGQKSDKLCFDFAIPPTPSHKLWSVLNPCLIWSMLTIDAQFLVCKHSTCYCISQICLVWADFCLWSTNFTFSEITLNGKAQLIFLTQLWPSVYEMALDLGYNIKAFMISALWWIGSSQSDQISLTFLDFPEFFFPDSPRLSLMLGTLYQR